MEFQDLLFPVTDKWEGLLSITTTGIHDKDVNHYRMNVGDAVSPNRRLTRLLPTLKGVGIFSGTEVCFSTREENVDGLVAWVVHFVKKVLIPKVDNIAIEILVEHINGVESRCERVIPESANDFESMSTSSIEHLVSGLEDYVLKHRNVLAIECQSCFPSRELIKVGRGLACSTENNRGTGQITEAVILVTAESLQPCCRAVSCSTTEVLYFQDYTPSQIPQSFVNALTSIDWQSYGLGISGTVVDGEGHAVFEWESLPTFGQMTIAIHSYQRKVMLPQIRQSTQSDRNMLKKAVKVALDDLKGKDRGLFLSSQAVKIRDYAPDLSRSIAGLIISSDDSDFQGDCATLLGLSSSDACIKDTIEACIQEKIIRIIESNDGEPKMQGDILPYLFEGEIAFEEEFLNEDIEDACMLDI